MSDDPAQLAPIPGPGDGGRGLLVAIAVVLVATRSHLSYLYSIYAKAEAACKRVATVRDVSINLSQLDKLLELIGTALVASPLWSARSGARR